MRAEDAGALEVWTRHGSSMQAAPRVGRTGCGPGCWGNRSGEAKEI